MSVPLRVVRGAGICIADRHALHVRLVQKAKHHSQTLGASADKGNIDPIARRNVPCSAQHPAWNDRETNRRSGGLAQELTPRHDTLYDAARPHAILHRPSNRSSETLTLLAAATLRVYHRRNRPRYCKRGPCSESVPGLILSCPRNDIG